MHNHESHQPKSGQSCGWGFWFIAVLALSPAFPAVSFVVFLLGLFVLCAVYRWAAVVLGLTLAVTCAIGAIEMLSDPKTGDMALTGLLFLPWAGFGLWLAARGFFKKRE